MFFNLAILNYSYSKYIKVLSCLDLWTYRRWVIGLSVPRCSTCKPTTLKNSSNAKRSSFKSVVKLLWKL